MAALPEECRLVITSELGTVQAQARRRWCEEDGSGGMQAGFELLGLDAAAHRRLVELIFTGERSWLTPLHPRDDPFRSFAYLLSTLWRVTEPRRPSRRQAPRVRGRWPCRVDGEEGVGLVASPHGALVELSAPLSPNGPRVVRLVLGNDAFEASARVVGQEGPRRVALAFAWVDTVTMNGFARALYARPGHPVASPGTARRGIAAGPA
jgi:hypothetical protein